MMWGEVVKVIFDSKWRRVDGLANRLLGAAVMIVVGAIGAAAPAAAADEATLSVAAIGRTPTDTNSGGGILAGRTSNIAAAADFHDYICAYNSDGGMLTAIMDAALQQEISGASYNVSIASGKNAHQDALAHKGTQMSFPWYKPNCGGTSFLTSHTKSLCTDYRWSDSIYDMVVGYFSTKNYARPLRRHDDVYGATLCVPGVEFPQMLREVGISDLNTRIVVRKSPAACLTAVMKEEADLTLLPISMAATEVEHLGLEDQIVPYAALDRVMTIHAIAPVASDTSADDIALLNSGLQKIRQSGEWFETILKFADGHEHDHAYEREALQNLSAALD